MTHDMQMLAAGTDAALPLNISEGDLPERARTALRAAASDRATLAGEGQQSVESMVAELLPTAIASRVRKIVPPDFKVSEIGMKFSVEGKLFGCGVAGDVTVKLVPATS